MKRIHLYFGYFGDTKLSKLSYRLCSKLKFIPAFEIDFFRNGKLKHSLTVHLFNKCWRVDKFQGKSWRFEEILSNGKD